MTEEEYLAAQADADLAEKEERKAKNALDLLDGERSVIEKKKADLKAEKASTPRYERRKLETRQNELNEMILRFNERLRKKKKNHEEAKAKAEKARMKADAAKKAWLEARLTTEVGEIQSSRSYEISSPCVSSDEERSIPDDLCTALKQLKELRDKAEEKRKEYEAANKSMNDMLDAIFQKFGLKM